MLLTLVSFPLNAGAGLQVSSVEITTIDEGSLYDYALSGENGEPNPALTFSVTPNTTLPSFLNLDFVFDEHASTVAGGNAKGNATNQLSDPSTIALDTFGNIYVADTYNHRIMKWTPGDVNATVVAGGNGSGTATNQLKTPHGVAIDSSGNIYVSDFYNNRVMKWAPGATEGVVVAGGNGYGNAANQFQLPHGITLDSAGNMYVADSQNYRVMRWDVNATEGVLVAGGNGRGSDTDQFDAGNAVALDASGNIYVADYSNDRIMRWAPDATEGVLVAGGNGSSAAMNQINNPLGVSVDASDNIYVADTSNHRIMRWALGATEGVQVAGGNGFGSATNQLFSPNGVTLDTSGNMYVTDTKNQRIQKFNGFYALRGTPTNEDVGVYDINLTLSDGTQNVAHNFTLAVNNVDFPPVDIFLSPSQISENSVTNTVIGVLNTVDLDSNETHVYSICTSPGTDDANFSLSGNSLLSNGMFDYEAKGSYSVCIKSTDSASLSLEKNVTIKIVNINEYAPTVTSTPESSVAEEIFYDYVLSGSDGDNDALSFSINSNSTLPSWLSLNLMFTDENASTVAGGNNSGSAVNQLDYPHEVIIDGWGNSYVADTSNHRIMKWAPGATEGVLVAGGNGEGNATNQLAYPYGITLDSLGNIYIADTYNHRILRWESGAQEGVVVAGNNGLGDGTNQFNYPIGVTFDASGNMYVLDKVNSRVMRWVPGATEGVLVAGGNGRGTATNQLNNPDGITLDSLGNIYIADTTNHRIIRWAPGGIEGVVVAGGNGYGSATDQLANPSGVTLDDWGNIYIADLSNNRIMRWISGATEGVLVAGGNDRGSAANQLSSPIGVTLDVSGNIYVADSSNHRIQKFNGLFALQGTPMNADVGVYDINLTLSDGNNEVAHNFVITVNNINDAPTASNVEIGVNEDSVKIFSADDFNVSDIDVGDTMDFLYISSVPDRGVLKYNDVNVIMNQKISDFSLLTFTPELNEFAAPYTSFEFIVNDGEANSTSAYTSTINVLSVNDVPNIIISSTLTTNEDYGQSLSFSLSDVEDANLTLKIESNATNAVVSILGTDVTYTPTLNYNGSDSFTVSTTDSDGAKVTQTISVTVSSVNDIPTITIESILETDEDNIQSLIFSLSDVEDSALTLNVESNASHGVVSISGMYVVYTPTPNYYGNDSFTVSTTDSDGSKVTQSITVIVASLNDIPTITIASTLTTNEDYGQSLNFSLSDIEDVNLMLKVESNASNGSVTVSESNVVYTPTPNYNGSDSFIVSTTDSNGAKVTQTISVTVASINDIPTITIDSTLTTNEDNEISLSFTFNDVDEDTVSAFEKIAPTNGAISISGTIITYTPTPNYNGDDIFSITMTDHAGYTTDKTITVTVSAVNDIPKITIASTLTTNEDNTQSLTFSLSDVEDSSALALNIESNATNGTVTVLGSDVSYTPTANYNGSDSFTVSTTDSDGAKVTQTISITVASVNDIPTITIDSTLTTQEDGSSSLSFSVMDVDDDTVLPTVFTNALYGTVVIEGSTLNYTPTLNYNGEDSFTLLFDDGNEGLVSKTITVTVSSVNDIPTISITNTLIVNADSSTTITFTYSDIDEDIVSATLQSDPLHGVVTINATNIIYTPVTGYVGSDNFSLSLSDAQGYVLIKTVDVTVLANTMSVDVTTPSTNELTSEISVTENNMTTVTTTFEDESTQVTIIKVSAPESAIKVSLDNNQSIYILKTTSTEKNTSAETIAIVNPDATVLNRQIVSDENNLTRTTEVQVSRNNVQTTIDEAGTLTTSSLFTSDTGVESSTTVSMNHDGGTLHTSSFTTPDGITSTLRLETPVSGTTTEFKADGSTKLSSPVMVSDNNSTTEFSVEITPEGIIKPVMIITKSDGTQRVVAFVELSVNSNSEFLVQIVEEADGSISLKIRTLIPDSGIKRLK